MNIVFLKITSMSLSSSWLILTVIIFRILFHKAPKRFCCLLWSFVALKLLFPIQIESEVGFIPSAENIYYILKSLLPVTSADKEIITQTLNPALITSNSISRNNFLYIFICVMSYLWLVGIVLLLTYTIIRYIRLKKITSASVAVANGIKICDEIPTAFVFGIIKPTIFVPSSFKGKQLNYVIAHETSHIMGLDYIWKPIGYMVLLFHWHNPLCWIAYMFFCRDIELSCDERSIARLSTAERLEYANTLLASSPAKKSRCKPSLTFGTSNIKSRVNRVLTYTNPTKHTMISSVFFCFIIFFLSLAGTKKFDISENAFVKPIESLNIKAIDLLNNAAQSGQITELYAWYIDDNSNSLVIEVSEEISPTELSAVIELICNTNYSIYFGNESIDYIK